MQKLSETVYSSLFWLISGLLVWLVVVPVTLICLPIIILLKAAGTVLFQMPRLNVVEAERRSQTNPKNQSANAVEPIVATLLLKTLVELPAFLAAVISLQPTRLSNSDRTIPQTLQPHVSKAPEAIEVPAEEKTSGT